MRTPNLDPKERGRKSDLKKIILIAPTHITLFIL